MSSSYKRSTRCTQRTPEKYSDYASRWHYWGKSKSIDELEKWPITKWGLYFCLLWLQKYNSSLTKERFHLRKSQKTKPCIVCREVCLWDKWHKRQILLDLETVSKLVGNESLTKKIDNGGMINLKLCNESV